MIVLRCNFFDLDRPSPGDPIFAECLIWLKNNQEAFITSVVDAPITFYGAQVGHVLSACFKEKKFVVVVNSCVCNIDPEYVCICFTIQTQGPQIHTCELYVTDYRLEGFVQAPSFKVQMYENQYEYLLNRELGEF